jgi:hypothetical protein
MTLTFQPISKSISSITNANPAVVTTSTSHGYKTGIYVRMVFPLMTNPALRFGMPEVNGNVYLATVLSPTTFSLNVDSTSFQPFSINTTKQVPMVIPVGEVSSTFMNVEKNNLVPIGGS